jgi:hypothetical protein
MDHPETGVFSCPYKSKSWHTKEYGKLVRELDQLSYSSFGITPEGQARKAEVLGQIERLKS